MTTDVDRNVRNCHVCQRSKAIHQKIHGWLKLLEVPQQPWKDLSMDFVVGPPESEGYNAVWVVVDRLSKMKHLVPCRDDMSRLCRVRIEGGVTIESQYKWNLKNKEGIRF